MQMYNPMEKGLSDVNLLKCASAERHINFVSRRLICKDLFIFPDNEILLPFWSVASMSKHIYISMKMNIINNQLSIRKTSLLPNLFLAQSGRSQLYYVDHLLVDILLLKANYSPLYKIK